MDIYIYTHTHTHEPLARASALSGYVFVSGNVAFPPCVPCRIQACPSNRGLPERERETE